ncbi:putative ribonuclease H-like domain-containing protein [Tanacetum coccineum]
MCDKKNSVHFTDTACVVLSPDFKLTDENHVLLKVPRKDNMYSVDLNNVVPQGGLTCLFEKDTPDESNLCHRRLGQGIKMEFSVARTSQQNGVAKRKNMTLIEAARTMLADLKLPTTFWAEAVNIACYVKNKADEGFFVGYSTNSKAFRVFNNRTRIVEENLHVQFSKNTPNITGSGPNWLFDIDALTMSMNYKLIVTGNQSNDPPFSSSSKDSPDVGFKPSGEEEKKDVEDLRNKYSKVLSTKEPRVNQEKDVNVNSTNNINIVSSPVNAAGIQNNVVDENIVYGCADDPNMPELEEIGIFSDAEDDNSGADMNNLDTYFQVSLVPTIRIHKDHPIEQIIGDLNSAPQTRRMTKNLEENAIETKWVFRNKKDERGIVIKNKARLAAQGYTQEEGINYDEVFAPVARIEAIRLFLAYASFKDFVVYHMNGKSAFLYGKIKEEVYVCQSPGFEDLYFLDRVYKVEKALYGLHQAPRAWVKSDILLVQVYVDDIIFGSTRKKMCTGFEMMMHKKFQMSFIGELTFFLCLQIARTPIETQKALLKDAYGEDVDEHLYRSMIGSLMYLTSLRPDIMFAVCACARFQVNPKVSHLHAVKRIFRYLKGQPKLGLWYPKDSPFDLVAYTDSDYAGAHLDRKSTTGGCQFLGCRLISWQCKKQTLVANSPTKAEYIAASNCCGQNPVFHSKTKHLEIRHHFIRDSNEKKLIQMIKIHIDQNVADFLTKAFDIQALVDKKKVIITEMSVRCDLQLEDAEGTECLPNATIFEQLTLMGYENLTQKLTFYKAFFSPQWKFLIHTILQYLSAKTTAWDEFSSTMASTIILFLDKQVEGMSKHKEIYVIPSHTKKVIANMKRQGKDFSGRVTPLFPTMMVQTHEEVGEGLANPTDPYPTPTIIQPSISKPQKKHPMKFKKKNTEVLDLETSKIAQAQEITSLKQIVKKLKKKKKSITPGLKRLRKVGRSARVVSFEDEEVTLIDEPQGRNDEDLMFDTGVLDEQEVEVENVVSTAKVEVTTASATTTTVDELTLAQTLIEIKAAKPKVRGVMIQEPSEFIATTSPSQSSQLP